VRLSYQTMKNNFYEYFEDKDIEKIQNLLQKMTCSIESKEKNCVITEKDIKNGLNKYYDHFVNNFDFIYDERTENMLNITKKNENNNKFVWLMLNDYYYSRPLYYIVKGIDIPKWCH
jgi:uncharacterized Fe-S cluster-containing protein